MRGELTPITEQGKRFVALAEEHAADFATRAAQHDFEGSFPHENIEAMKKSGVMAATSPEDIGGLGVFSIHDMAIGLSRIARGDASTAIAVNMHLISVWIMTRQLRSVQAGGPGAPEPLLLGLLKGVVSGGLVAAVPGTEPGTTIRYPTVEVTPDGEGFVLNGRKIFGTMSPASTVLFSNARLADGNGGYTGVLCMVGRDAPGVELVDNWDALGMRASGSGDVVYKDVRLPSGSVIRSNQPLGAQTLAAGDGMAGNLGLLGCFVGIAEAAAGAATDMVKARRKGPTNTLMAERQWMQHLVGEMEVDLYACRSALAHNARMVDQHVARYPKQDAPPEESAELDRVHQCAKYIVNRRAIDAVDKALTASGGAGYMSKHVLSRLYRDVRAGPFMQPFSPPEALEFIGRETLGQPRSEEL